MIRRWRARYNRGMVPRLVALACGLAATALAGCASVQARSEAPMPVLAPPEAPPRVVAEYEPDPPLPAAPVAADAVAPPPRVNRPVRRDAPRTEAPAEEPQTTPPTVPAAPAPALALQRSAASQRADQSVRTLLAQAALDLGRVNYQALDDNGRAQYDIARRFMQQADEALRARNLSYAGKLADKAATMAAVLVR